MKVKFLPQDVEYEIKPNQSVMNLAHDNGIHIQSVCKGIPSCAECRVKVVEGANNVLPPFSDELDLIGTAHFVDQRRLSCQLRCFGDLTVDTTEQIEKESVSTMQPRGKIKKEEGESAARLGNILDETKPEDLEGIEDEITLGGDKNLEQKNNKTHQQQKSQKKASSENEGDPKRKKKKRPNHRRRRNNNNRKKKTENKA